MFLLPILMAALPSSLSPGTTTLPASASGQVLSLLQVSIQGARVSLARSYDGHPWETTQGGVRFALRCDALQQCAITIPDDDSSYRIEAYSATFGNEDTLKASSRLLTQATFGPTRSEVHAVSLSMRQPAGSTAAIRDWLSAQMAFNASLHRAYYRARVNTRTSMPSATGGVHSACTAGSRWHRFAFTNAEKKKDVVVASGGAIGYTMSIDGVVRTELASGSPALPSAVGTYTLKYIEERVGGTIWLCPGSGDASCRYAQAEQVANPPIEFGGSVDASVTHVMLPTDDGASSARLVPFAGSLVPNASLLDGELACTPQLRAQPYIYLRTADAAFHRHDPRVVMLANTLREPAHHALASTSGVSLWPQALTAADLDGSAAALASAPSELVIGAASGQYWNAIPSVPQSYSVRVGDAVTFRYGSAHNVYLVSAESKWYSCDKSGGTVLSGFHVGGGEGTGYLANLYRTTVSAAGTLYIVCAPHCGAGQKVRLQVLPLAGEPPPPPPPLSSIGALPLPSVPKTFLNLGSCHVLTGEYSGFEACGSPGEVANEPERGNQYNTFLTDIGDPPQGWPPDVPATLAAVAAEHQDELEQTNEVYQRRLMNKRLGKNMVWTMVVLQAPDQLRQRVAWALYQIFVISDASMVRWPDR